MSRKLNAKDWSNMNEQMQLTCAYEWGSFMKISAGMLVLEEIHNLYVAVFINACQLLILLRPYYGVDWHEPHNAWVLAK